MTRILYCGSKFLEKLCKDNGIENLVLAHTDEPNQFEIILTGSRYVNYTDPSKLAKKGNYRVSKVVNTEIYGKKLQIINFDNGFQLLRMSNELLQQYDREIFPQGECYFGKKPLRVFVYL